VLDCRGETPIPGTCDVARLLIPVCLPLSLVARIPELESSMNTQSATGQFPMRKCRSRVGLRPLVIDLSWIPGFAHLITFTRALHGLWPGWMVPFATQYPHSSASRIYAFSTSLCTINTGSMPVCGLLSLGFMGVQISR
jgi:hypothetical protein